MARSRFLPDNFTLALLSTVLLATLLPASGRAAQFFDGLTTLAIALLFFLHGAKLSREAILNGITHWRLHLLVFCATFVLFPLLGLALKPVLAPLVTPALYVGVLYMCVLPATVQSAIAFTSLARGNVPAAVCSASASTLLGVLVTPLLVNIIVLPQGGAGVSLDSVGRILLQLMLPFVSGHLMRPWIGRFVHRHAATLKFVDQGSILLVVYGAFSEAVNEGIWQLIPVWELAGLVLVCCIFLALVLASATVLGKVFGFNQEDRITILFCGSKKSLATGVPMAQVLFAGSTIGVLILPLMLFHQIQLMVCAVLAQRYAKRQESVAELMGQVDP